MQKRDAAAFLAGVSQTEGSQASAPTNLHVISGEVGTRSEDGKTTVAIDGLVFSEADDQYVEMDTLGGLEEGDVTTVILTGESGHAMTPLAIGSVGSVDTIRDKAEAADSKSTIAQTLAQAAKAVAEAVGQHFWTDSDGVHVTEVTEDEWKDDEEGSTTYHSGANVLINSIGQLFRSGTNNLLGIVSGTEPGVTIYDGNGNESANVVATFTRTLIELGRNATSAVISLCGGRGIVRYAYESDFEKYIFHIESDGDFNVESRYESDDKTSTGVAGIKIGGTEQSQSLHSTQVALVATESDSAVDRIHTGRVTVGSGTSVDNPSDYGDASYVNVDGANVDIKADQITFADPYTYNYKNRGGGTLQLGKPTTYQNNGEYAITTAGIDTLHNGPRITIPAGYYMFVGQWTFNSASASGDRNMQVGFRSGASGSLWGERVRIRQSSGNFNALNVSALREFTSETTVYLAGSASITSGKAGCYITAVRLN